MDTQQSEHIGQEQRRAFPRPRPFRPPTEADLLLARMERTVDEIVEALSELGAADSQTSPAPALSLAAAARRLFKLAGRWPSPPGS